MEILFIISADYFIKGNSCCHFFSEIQKRSNQRNCSIASKLRVLMFFWFFESHCSLSSHATLYAYLVEFILRMKLQSGPAEGSCRKIPWEQDCNGCNSASFSQLHWVPPELLHIASPLALLPSPTREPGPYAWLSRELCLVKLPQNGTQRFPSLCLGKAVTVDRTPDPCLFSHSLALNHIIQGRLHAHGTLLFCIFIENLHLKRKKEKKRSM